MERREKNKKKLSAQFADKETVQRLISVTDDMLKTLITMSSALLAIGVIFTDFVKSPLMRVIIILTFFIGLISSFLGVLPLNIRYNLEDAEELQNQEVRVFFRKRRHLWFGAAAMMLGFILIMIDLFIDVFSKNPA
ncbi:MAG: hypothetical protein LUE93_08210 [Bacteroides sp.]|nr:hypothetical protein [Bacteroides sp.]